MQPKLNHIIFSEDSIVSKNGSLSLINIFENINAKKFPALQYKFCVVVNFNLTDELPHKLKIQILDPKKNLVTESGEYTIEIKSGQNRVQVANTFINTPFNEKGDYSINCVFDNENVWDKILTVKEA